MAAPELDIRAYREGDEADVVALWTRVFAETRPWNQPAAYVRRKLAVQTECAAGSITWRSYASSAGTASAAR